MPLTRTQREEAAELLRSILLLVETQEITAESPGDLALIRHLQGALSAIEAIDVR